MDEFVADTHALFWYLIDSPRLGPNAVDAFEAADAGQAIIHVPAIVLAELYYLNVKLGGSIDFAQAYRDLESSSQFVLTSFEPLDVLDFDNDAAISEMHDRMIAGLARCLGCKLISADEQVSQNAAVSVVW